MKNIYHIVLCSHGKEIKHLYHTTTEEKANAKFKELVELNSSVVFPVEYINNGKIKKADYEIIMVKYNNKELNKKTEIRNDNGDYITYSTNSECWHVIDRSIYLKEETFWVYGFHPQLQRKDFTWIYDNYIKNGLNKTNMQSCMVFKNKLIFDRNDEFKIIICKNKDDCVRLYNQLESKAINNKCKYTIWCNDITKSPVRKNIFKRLKEFTGWSYTKLMRSSLRP